MAVTIRNGFKRYGNGGLVLKDFDMTVGIGEMYVCIYINVGCESFNEFN